MKIALKCLLMVAVLFCAMPGANAAFHVKRVAALEATAIATKTANYSGHSELNKVVHSGIAGRIHNLLHPALLSRNGYAGPNKWYGPVALACGVLGLLIPGMNFAAILFGVLGMGRRSTMKGMAVAGFALGLIELAIFLAAQTVFISLILL